MMSATLETTVIPKEGKLSDYIYQKSSYLGKFSELIRFIVNLANSKQKNTSNLSVSDSQSLYFLSLDQLAIEINNTKSLTESLKKKQAVDDVFKEILDISHGGQHKVGYLYPILFIDNGKLACKINIFSALEEKTHIQPYRNKSFNFSTPVIDMLFSGKIRSVKRIKEAETPENIVMTVLKNKDLSYNPLGISFEHDIESFLRKAYIPYEYIPIKDFVQDVIAYGLKVDQLEEINPDYHIIKEEVELDDMGKVRKYPEVFFHYWGHLKAINKILSEELHKIAKDSKLLDLDASITDFKNKFKKELDTDPFKELDRVEDLIQIIDRYPIQSSFSEGIKNLIFSTQEGSRYLRIFKEKIFTIYEDGKKNLIESSLVKFGTRISNTSRDKKIVQTIRINQIPEMASFKEPTMAKEFQTKILNYIHKNLGVYEEIDTEGKKIYYVLDPAFYSAILLNHGKLASNGESSKKLYEIVKKIHTIMLAKNIKLKVDSRIHYLELQTIREGLYELEVGFKREKTKEEKNSKFNTGIAIFTFFFSLLLFLGLLKLLSNPFILMLGVPVSGFLAYSFGKLFNKKVKKNKNDSFENKIPEKKAKDKTLGPYFELAESIVFPNSFKTIEERIITRKKLRKILNDTYPSLKNKSYETFKDMSDEKALGLLETTITENSVSIEIPSEFVPKNEANLFFFSKTDLRSPLLKKKIIDHLNQESSKNKKLEKYYSFLIVEINNEVNSI
jgi:hypothetical protein